MTAPAESDLKVIKQECRHVVFCEPNKDAKARGITSDMHFIKLQELWSDGVYRPRFAFKENFERPFWVTKPACRNHKDKKEFEYLERLDKRTCTQSNLVSSILRALGEGWKTPRGLKQVCDSPYVYGADIPSTSLIKHAINSKNTESQPSTLAIFDIETNMFSQEEEIILAALTYKERVVQVIDRKFFNGHTHDLEGKERDEFIVKRVTQEWVKWLSKDIEKRKIKLEIVLVDTEIDIVREIFKRAHKWMPDIIGGWNVIFDIEKCVEAAERAGVNIADIMCDPSVPKEYRTFEIKYGVSSKTTASGKHKPLDNHMRWTTVDCPASFEIQDTMRVFKYVRTGQPDEIAYTLDHQLKKQIGREKLDTGSVKTDNGTDWHRGMQKDFPFEYCAYNGYDCIGPEQMDEKTFDHALAVPALIGDTSFHKAPSVPFRQTVYYHFLALEHGRVISTTGTKPWAPYLRRCMSLSNWIVMLEPIYLTHEGARCVEESEYITTNIYVACADIDVSAAYPTATMVLNVSRDTQTKFIISVDGIREEVVRVCMLNFSGGAINSLQIMEDMFNFPFIDDVIKAFDEMPIHERDRICKTPIRKAA